MEWGRAQKVECNYLLEVIRIGLFDKLGKGACTSLRFRVVHAEGDGFSVSFLRPHRYVG